MTDHELWENAAPVPEIPPPPRLTRTEQATWVAYGLIAILLLVIPVATHSFGLPDLAAWVLLAGAVAMSAIWLGNGALRGPEWLLPEEHERFLKEIQRLPGDDPVLSTRPTPTSPPAGPAPSSDPPPRP